MQISRGSRLDMFDNNEHIKLKIVHDFLELNWIFHQFIITLDLSLRYLSVRKLTKKPCVIPFVSMLHYGTGSLTIARLQQKGISHISEVPFNILSLLVNRTVNYLSITSKVSSSTDRQRAATKQENNTKQINHQGCKETQP